MEQRVGTVDKFISKLNRIPKDVTFKELHAFLVGSRINLSFRVKGSHYIYFYDEDDVKLVIPNHGTVKSAYIKKVVDFLEEQGIDVEE